MPSVVWRAIGAGVRALGRSRAGRRALRLTGRGVGEAIGRALGGNAGAGALPAARRWLAVLDAVGCRYEIALWEHERVEVRVLACPAGLERRDGREVCLAGMEADRALVARLGARLEIGETIASGARSCQLAVVTLPAGDEP